MARHRKPDGVLWNYLKWYFGRGHDPFDYRPRPTYRVPKRGAK